MTAVYSIIRKSEAINRDQAAKKSLEEGNPLLDAREAVMVMDLRCIGSHARQASTGARVAT